MQVSRMDRQAYRTQQERFEKILFRHVSIGHVEYGVVSEYETQGSKEVRI